MTRVFTILSLLLVFGGAVSAQSTFSVTATEVWTIAPHYETDVEGHFDITNTTNVVQTIKWERSVINITNGCSSQVCDINLCYLPHISSKTFDLAGNATGNIIMHFLNPDSLMGASGILHLKMSNVNVPQDTVTVAFLFTSESSNTDNPLPAATVKMFPNPTVDYFQLQNADAVNRIRVFSLDNREVARFTATPGEIYSLSSQPAGTYVLALEDESGRVFQALELVKK